MTLKLSEISDICSWFQRQQGATRVETIVSLLGMLYPLELQFVGAYLEDLARRDYHCLRDVEHRSNIAEMVPKLSDVLDSRCRASLIVALSLLKSTNTKTATVFYQILLSLQDLRSQLTNTKDVYEEILLLLTMAKHHPAFKFEQKTSLSSLLEETVAHIRQEPHLERDSPECANGISDKLVSSRRRRKGTCNNRSVDAFTQTEIEDFELFVADEPTDKIRSPEIAEQNVNSAVGGPPPQPDVVESFPVAAVSSVLSTSPDLKASDIYITRIKVKGSQRKENVMEFTLETTWYNGDITEIVKTQEDLYEFHRKLLDLFPSDAGCYGYNRRIPYFPGYRHSPELDINASPKIIPDFLAVNEDILASRYAAKFFKPAQRSSSPVTFSSPVGADTQAVSSCFSPDNVGGSTYGLNMLFVDPNSTTSSTCRQQTSNDTNSNEDEQDFVDEDGRLKSLIYYNSHMSPSSPGDQSPPANVVTPVESSTSCSLTYKTPSHSSHATFVGGDISSTSRVVPLPAGSVSSQHRHHHHHHHNRVKDPSSSLAPIADNSCAGGGDSGVVIFSGSKPAAYQSSSLQGPLIYVPKELYMILRRENLLRLKKVFASVTLEELFDMKSESDVVNKLKVSEEDKTDVLTVLGIFRKENSIPGTPKNVFSDKSSKFAQQVQKKLENLELTDNAHERSCVRAQSTSSVDTNDYGQHRYVNGEVDFVDQQPQHEIHGFQVGRSNSSGSVHQQHQQQSLVSSGYHKQQHSSRPKSFHHQTQQHHHQHHHQQQHRHHSKNQMRKHSIPLNVERLTGNHNVDDSNAVHSDSSCVSETPFVIRNQNEDEYVQQSTQQLTSYFGVSPLPSDMSCGRGRSISKTTSNSLPPSKSQSPVPVDLPVPISATAGSSGGANQYYPQVGHRKSLTPCGGVGAVYTTPAAPPIATAINYPPPQRALKTQPIRCTFSDAPAGAAALAVANVSTAAGASSSAPRIPYQQPPTLPPPAAYDLSRPNNLPPLFAVPPPPTSPYGFFRNQPPPPQTLPCCQCNSGGTCQLCLANRWNLAAAASAAGTMFLHFGPAAQHYALAVSPQQQQQQHSAASIVSPQQFAGAGPPQRGGLTLDLSVTAAPPCDENKLYCLMPTFSSAAAMQNISPNELMVAVDPKICCSNCGIAGHTADYCGEATLDEITSAGQYHLNLRM